jgi:hypothetical protein
MTRSSRISTLSLVVLSVLFLSSLAIPALASDIVITSPVAGDSFELGEDSIEFTWLPDDADTYKNAGVKGVIIEPLTDDRSSVDVYGPFHGDDISLTGELEFELPSYITLFNSGYYRLEVTEDDGSVVYSDEFRIVNPEHPEIVTLVEPDYAITAYNFSKDFSYEVGEDIEFSIDAEETEGTSLRGYKGFSVVYTMTDVLSGEAVDGGHGTDKSGRWYFVQEPISEPGEYEIELAVYCSDGSFDSYCRNEYQDEQLEEYVTVYVSDETSIVDEVVPETDTDYMDSTDKESVANLGQTDDRDELQRQLLALLTLLVQLLQGQQ